jgi:hypothetical protein
MSLLVGLKYILKLTICQMGEIETLNNTANLAGSLISNIETLLLL